MKINKSKIDILGQELFLLIKNYIEKEGLSGWVENVDPTLFKIEKTNGYKFLNIKDKRVGNSEPEEDFAIEFLVFIMWVVSYTIQHIFLKKNIRPEVVSGLNPHLEVDMNTEESVQILNVFHKKIYKWLEKTWDRKDLSVFEKFIGIRYENYYNADIEPMGSWGIEMPLFALSLLVKIIEEKSKQGWMEKLKKTNNKSGIKNIIINRYFNSVFEDMQRLVNDVCKKIKS